MSEVPNETCQAAADLVTSGRKRRHANGDLAAEVADPRARGA